MINYVTGGAGYVLDLYKVLNDKQHNNGESS